MGVSLFGVLAFLFVAFTLLKASPRSGGLSQTFTRKKSDSTHCKLKTAHYICEMDEQAEDVSKGSQDLQDSEMDTSCIESEAQAKQSVEGGEGGKMDKGADELAGKEKDEEVLGGGGGGKGEGSNMTDAAQVEKKAATGAIKEGKGKDDKQTAEKRKKRDGTDDNVKSKVVKQDKAKQDMDEEPLPPFPTTLEGFGYHFNDQGELQHKDTDEKFVFVVKEGDQRFNQAHYEALGEVITEYVYGLLEKEAKLKRFTVPVGAKKRDPKSFVFQSDDARTNKDKLMVLIHGSGVVRAGQWARRLIINDCLDKGTQLPYIKRAREEGYGVLVLNTNRNHNTVDGEEKPIKGNATPEEHAVYVWEHIIQKCAAKNVYIVAHSYGGVVTGHLADVSKFRSDFQKRVKKIAFTDSVHNFDKQNTSSAVRRWMASHSRNWISCNDPLDTELMMLRQKVPRVSAGTNKHEETSYYAMDSIFAYFKE